MLNGQNHKGSTYNIGRIIAEKIEGENEITEFFFPRDLNHFCVGCYMCIEDVSLCPYYSEKKRIIDAIAKKINSIQKLSVGVKTRIMFNMMGMMQKNGWNSSKVETEYWKENGWLDGKKPWNIL